MLKAIGFDFDGVFVRKLDKSARLKAADYAIEKLIAEGECSSGLSSNDKLPNEKLEQFFARILKDGIKAVPHAIELSDEYYISQKLENIKTPIDGIFQLLCLLQSKQIPFFIASNNASNRLFYNKFFADEFGQVPFTFATYDGNVPPKPAPNMILKGFKEIGINADNINTAFVGDRVSKDLLASFRANVMPILICDDINLIYADAEMCEIKIKNDFDNQHCHKFNAMLSNISYEFLVMRNLNDLYKYIECE